MDLIADINHSLRADWVFIVMLLIMIYLVFLQWRFKDEFRLFSRAFFSLKASSQLHREKLSSHHLLYYSPIIIVVLSLLLKDSNFSLGLFFTNAFWVLVFFLAKLLVMSMLIALFEIKQYKEMLWHGFLYEMIAGVSLIPFLLLLFYGPFQAYDIRFIIYTILFLVFLYKLIRIGYISFFYSSFSKAHIIIYLCTLEILPIVIITKESF